MSVTMDQGADALLQAALARPSPEELSDIEVDGDGSSSLSEIEDKDAEQDEDIEGSDDELSNISDDENEENDSEAETERLEESPNKFRPQKDVVLSSHNGNTSYDHTPSKLHNQITAEDQEDDDDDDEDPLSEAELSMDESPESPKSSNHEDADEVPTAPTSLDDSSGENKNLLSIESDTRKRKRSIMAGSGLEEELGEPLRKRTGSVMKTGDEYAVDDDTQQEEDLDIEPNHLSGNISGDEGGVVIEDGLAEGIEEVLQATAVAAGIDTAVSPKKRGRKRRKGIENGVHNAEEPENVLEAEAIVNGQDDLRRGEEDNAENEGDDEADAAQKNEEELYDLQGQATYGATRSIEQGGSDA
ncbi:hypothetical protein M7I_1512 [Glarea lozoyensis 74030]|uniref:Uncharacterized protein n=1 Tax=Glarea lozoyensis (strain ATCC 74030 / MF5533) TaxID=1104152 RepID=H0EGA0_GLAL7|nr:hypothetical protein M7I_1512 [Glarea lozoyensis 74030]